MIVWNVTLDLELAWTAEVSFNNNINNNNNNNNNKSQASSLQVLKLIIIRETGKNKYQEIESNVLNDYK